MKNSTLNMYLPFMVSEAIKNIKKFAKIAAAEGYLLELGFSGGKDSIVCFDLLKQAAVEFQPIFNYAFESYEVVNFIRDKYPEVEIRKKPTHYLKLIQQKGFLPSQQIRYCCDYLKENSKNALITGVRRSESRGRRSRKLFEIKGKKNIGKYDDVFSSECIETGKTPLTLRPIIDWNDGDVWQYIYENNLPYPQLYDDGQKRCGCMMCPLATLRSNLYYFQKCPALLNFSKKLPVFSDLKIQKTGEQYTAEQFIFVWLNHFE